MCRNCTGSICHISTSSAQAGHGRPRPDQIWIWGCIDAQEPQRFLFRVLDSAEDALDGKPRGKQELKTNFALCAFDDPSVLITSDAWKGTIVAVRELRQERGWPTGVLRRVNGCNACGPQYHQIVNHSAEFVNADGFTTNHIESAWSVLKRFLKRRCGGRLPPMERELVRELLNEFSFFRLVVGTSYTAPGAQLDVRQNLVLVAEAFASIPP